MLIVIDHGTLANCTTPQCDHATVIDADDPPNTVRDAPPQPCVSCTRAIDFYRAATLRHDGPAAMALEAVQMERFRQRLRWPEEHDDAHTKEDWERLIEDGALVDEDMLQGLGGEGRGRTLDRIYYTRAAALGLSALESLIRQEAARA